LTFREIFVIIYSEKKEQKKKNKKDLTKTKKYVIILVSEKGSEFMLDILREVKEVESTLESNVFDFTDEDRTQCGLVLLTSKKDPIIIDNKDISDVFHTHTSLLEYYFGEDQSNIKYIQEAFEEGEDVIELLQENDIYYRFSANGSRFVDISENNNLCDDFVGYFNVLDCTYNNGKVIVNISFTDSDNEQYFVNHIKKDFIELMQKRYKTNTLALCFKSEHTCKNVLYVNNELVYKSYLYNSYDFDDVIDNAIEYYECYEKLNKKTLLNFSIGKIKEKIIRKIQNKNTNKESIKHQVQYLIQNTDDKRFKKEFSKNVDKLLEM
jgi:hypothetical protein